MSQPIFRVLRSTQLTQLQDAGRFGVRHLGVTQSGALDWIAQHWANWLLGNERRACVLEVALGGTQLLCLADTHIALGGADLDARLDQQRLKPWHSVPIRAGQHLSFNAPQHGARAYLAVPGGFSSQPVLGSQATCSREALGGLQGDGCALSNGDELHAADAHAQHLRSMPAGLMLQYLASPQLDLILGAQIADFTAASVFAAFNQPWQIDTRADRMGVRLLGPTLICNHPAMISEGIALGAVQVPADGQPIVLLNERQTIGGYPRLGALTPQAVARLAQCLPGEQVYLRPITQPQAQREHRQFLMQLNMY